MRLCFAILTVVIFAGWPLTSSVNAQVSRVETTIVHIFNKSIQFDAFIISDIPVRAGVIFFRGLGDSRTNVGLAKITQTTKNQYQVSYLHQTADSHLRPFSTIVYHWELTLANGDLHSTAEGTYQYIDNRFAWKVLEDDQFKVYYQKGDLQFAQDILDIARVGKQHIQALIAIPMPEIKTIGIYVYNDMQSLQSALTSQGENWVAGHADPDLGVILVALPDSPEQGLLAKQRIPHELMHILLYQAYPNGYANIPVWLKEGLASLSELYPNSDYRIIIDDAAKTENLLPISALCDSFPGSTSEALLAYGEAQYFTKSLLNFYGKSGIRSLLQAYANGLDCERGAQFAFGKSLAQLDQTWRHEVLSESPLSRAYHNMLPWLLLLFTMLIAPIGLILRRICCSSAGR